MSAGILFFEKNKADYSDSNVVATASQGNDYAPRVTNRSNLTAWMTTGSVDADLTTLTINWADPKQIDSLILVKHNFKNYSVQYDTNGSGSYASFTSPVSTTNDFQDTTYWSFDQVEAFGVKVTINGTRVANDEKYLYQLIASLKIGRFDQMPAISNPTISRNRSVTKMLSGKSLVRENVGFFRCELVPRLWYSGNDLAVIERLYKQNTGFLTWLCGDDEAQFAFRAEGYRKEDIYLMKPVNEYEPEWFSGQYHGALRFKLSLAEVVD